MRSAEIRDKKCADCDALIMRKSTRCRSHAIALQSRGRVSVWKGKKLPYSVWNKGRKWTDEEKRHISLARKASPFRWSDEDRRRMSRQHKGERCPFWKGGITAKHLLIRRSIEYRLWREAVFRRDQWTCVWCGQVGGELNADHIKSFAQYPALRFSLENGRTLCVGCHEQTDTYRGRSINKKLNLINDIK